MNRLAQFSHYCQKVFGLRQLIQGVRDRREQPQIPTQPIFLTLLFGAVLRVASYFDLARKTRKARWQQLTGLGAPLSDDTLGYVTERLSIDDLRATLVAVNQKLKANKALESCKINGLLFVSLDANEHFHSRSRTCPCCCQRELEEMDEAGQKQTFIQFYHRYVFAQINGAKMNVLLDLEPIRPGEEECQAALRLLGRLRRRYGVRFFDAITVDAWYVKGPFLRAVEKLGWQWVVVLKQERLDVFQEAQKLTQAGPPQLIFHDKERQRDVQLWEVSDLTFSEGYGKLVRVVRSEEHWIERKKEGARKIKTPRQSTWLWMVSPGLSVLPPSAIYQAGHRRWGIENHAFNELTQRYHLEHCYHHEPTSMLVQMLILLIGFTLFTAFAKLHCQLVRLGELTLKALAEELHLALEAELPWEQWFACG
jgi:hypothetical protein